MQAPTWLKPASMGAVAGAIVTMVVGFNQGGWYTGGSAEQMADQRAAVAVVAALVPICVNQSQADPEATVKLKQLAALSTSYERRDFVMKSGWATMPTADSADRALAIACADMLSKAAQG